MNHPTDQIKQAAEKFSEFLEIIKTLRDPAKGCPWDKEQTFQSLKPLLIEEVYEVADAIEKDPNKIHEELGDVLSIIALFCQIGFEKNLFAFSDVLSGISSKLIRRHPHIFADSEANTSKEVEKNWESIKQQEKRETSKNPSALAGVPASLPALLKAHRVGEKCARLGFEWNTVEEVKDKVLEELQEFVETLDQVNSSKERQAEEFGDVFFSLCQLARRQGFNPEELTRAAVDKFIKRFQKIEQLAYERGNLKGIEGMTLEQMDALWEEVKRAEYLP